MYDKKGVVYKTLTGYLSRYHYYSLDDDTNVGTILAITYNKQFSNTGLRLTSSGVHMDKPCCGTFHCAQW